MKREIVNSSIIPLPPEMLGQNITNLTDTVLRTDPIGAFGLISDGARCGVAPQILEFALLRQAELILAQIIFYGIASVLLFYIIFDFFTLISLGRKILKHKLDELEGNTTSNKKRNKKTEKSHSGN